MNFIEMIAAIVAVNLFVLILPVDGKFDLFPRILALFIGAGTASLLIEYQRARRKGGAS